MLWKFHKDFYEGAGDGWRMVTPHTCSLLGRFSSAGCCNTGQGPPPVTFPRLGPEATQGGQEWDKAGWTLLQTFPRSNSCPRRVYRAFRTCSHLVLMTLGMPREVWPILSRKYQGIFVWPFIIQKQLPWSPLINWQSRDLHFITEKTGSKEDITCQRYTQKPRFQWKIWTLKLAFCTTTTSSFFPEDMQICPRPSEDTGWVLLICVAHVVSTSVSHNQMALKSDFHISLFSPGGCWEHKLSPKGNETNIWNCISGQATPEI